MSHEADQSLIDIHYIEKYLEEDFIITQHNIKAYNAIIPQGTHSGTKPEKPLIMLYAETKAGKTHLAKILSYKTQATFIKNSDDYIKHSGQEHFIVDDIDKLDPIEAFHIFNFVNNNNKKCLFTTSKYPLNFTIPDINSRLNTINLVKMQIPEETTTAAMLLRQFKERNINISTKVLIYIAARIERRMEVIIDFVQKIDLFALRTKRKISIECVKDFLNQLH